MSRFTAEIQPQAAPELRLLTLEEIDLVAGGRHHSALAEALASGFAAGASTFTDVVTRTIAFRIGDISIAIGFGFGIAISVGPGSGASVGVGVTTTAIA